MRKDNSVPKTAVNLSSEIEKMRNSPVIDIIVRLDTRRQIPPVLSDPIEISVIGVPGISSFEVRRILEAAKEKLEREELNQLRKQAEETQNAQEGNIHMADGEAGNP